MLEAFESYAEQSRFISFVETVCLNASLKILNNKDVWALAGTNRRFVNNTLRPMIQTTLEEVVKSSLLRIQKAAKAKISLKDLTVTRRDAKAKLTASINDERKALRKQLADSLRSARQKLLRLRQQLGRLEIKYENRLTPEGLDRLPLAVQLAKARERLRHAHALANDKIQSVLSRNEYHSLLTLALHGPVPKAVTAAAKENPDLPELSGIYFLWKNGVVEYVGQSTNIRKRVTLGSHHRLTSEHTISFVLFPKEDLLWAECWYIGVCRPRLNVGTPSLK